MLLLNYRCLLFLERDNYKIGQLKDSSNILVPQLLEDSKDYLIFFRLYNLQVKNIHSFVPTNNRKYFRMENSLELQSTHSDMPNKKLRIGIQVSTLFSIYIALLCFSIS
jgi:hypothetical protein